MRKLPKKRRDVRERKKKNAGEASLMQRQQLRQGDLEKTVTGLDIDRDDGVVTGILRLFVPSTS